MASKKYRKPPVGQPGRNSVFIVLILLTFAVLFYRMGLQNADQPVDLPAVSGVVDPTPADGGETGGGTGGDTSGGEIFVHFIDVGQGDSILIQTADNAVLIDAGERTAEKAVIQYLTDAGIETLDYVVATHPHSDHIGGLSGVIGQFEVKNVVMPDVTHTTATFERLLTAIEEKALSITVPKPGDTLSAGIITMTVLAPNSESYTDLNDYSIVLRLTYGETAFIFTGDAETHSEYEILEAGHTVQADVLKLGHHGSVTSTAEAFLDAVGPAAAVVCCGADNSYGHPHAETMTKLQARGITVYRTDEMGSIVMRTDGAAVTVAE